MTLWPVHCVFVLLSWQHTLHLFNVQLLLYAGRSKMDSNLPLGAFGSRLRSGPFRVLWSGGRGDANTMAAEENDGLSTLLLPTLK